MEAVIPPYLTETEQLLLLTFLSRYLLTSMYIAHAG